MKFYVRKQFEGAIDLVVDGTIKGAATKWHFDHHRPGGEKVQMDGIELGEAHAAKSVGTTMLDADAVCAAIWATTSPSEVQDLIRFEARLRALSYACDHLHVPRSIYSKALSSSYDEGYFLDLVEGLKQSSIESAKRRGIILFGQDRSPEEEIDRFYASQFDKQYHAVKNWALTGKLDGMSGYDGQPWYLIKADFNRKVETVRKALVSLGKIQAPYADIRAVNTFVPPLAYYRELKKEPVVIVTRDHPKGDIAYTVGVNPLSGENIDLTPAIQRLNELEPGWGGRATVFGSPFDRPSELSREKVYEIVKEVI